MLVAGEADATYEGGRVHEELRAPYGNNMKTTLDLRLESALSALTGTLKYNATFFPGERLELEKDFEPIEDV